MSPYEVFRSLAELAASDPDNPVLAPCYEAAGIALACIEHDRPDLLLALVEYVGRFTEAHQAELWPVDDPSEN